MIDRYSLCTSKGVNLDIFKSKGQFEIDPIYLASPTQLLPFIKAEAQHPMVKMHWGVHPDLAGKKSVSEKLFAIQKEKLFSSKRNRLSLKQRGIIPIDGYYAWKKISKKRSIAYRFVQANQEPFAIPGIWESYENEKQEEVCTFRWIIESGDVAMLDFSERVPLILSNEQTLKWLDNYTSDEELQNICEQTESIRLQSYPVSHLIADTKSNIPSIIEEVPPVDNLGNYSLFG